MPWLTTGTVVEVLPVDPVVVDPDVVVVPEVPEEDVPVPDVDPELDVCAAAVKTTVEHNISAAVLTANFIFAPVKKETP